MPNKKKTFCADASEMSDTERKIMASAMKAGQDQINIIRDARSQESEETEPKEDQDSWSFNFLLIFYMRQHPHQTLFFPGGMMIQMN